MNHDSFSFFAVDQRNGQKLNSGLNGSHGNGFFDHVYYLSIGSGQRGGKIPVVDHDSDIVRIEMKKTNLGVLIPAEDHDMLGHQYGPLRIRLQTSRRLIRLAKLNHVQIKALGHLGPVPAEGPGHFHGAFIVDDESVPLDDLLQVINKLNRFFLRLIAVNIVSHCISPGALSNFCHPGSKTAPFRDRVEKP
jgi:hypothetical protein